MIIRIERMFPEHPQYARERRWISAFVALVLIAATVVVLASAAQVS